MDETEVIKNEQDKSVVPNYDWYQTEGFIIVTILVKNLNREQVSVSYTETQLNVKIESDSLDCKLVLNLAHRIVPDKCFYKLMSTKIEVKLAKLEGIQWRTLLETNTETKGGVPMYPTSNPRHRDWNAIERDIVQELSQEKAAGEEGVNSLFQKIYGEGSDEVKRAMNKSYSESGGTVLSTNWNEIAKDKVPVKPPDGMEWKQWNN